MGRRITALMTGHAYATSARTAARMGPFAGYAENEEHMLRVLDQHRAAAAEIDEELVPSELLSRRPAVVGRGVRARRGLRRAQLRRPSVLAPTGTIGLMMDCDTTGIEPDLGLVQAQEARGRRHDVDRQPDDARVPSRNLGYNAAEIDEIIAYIDEHKTILGAPHLTSEHLAVFACSMGDNVIHYLGHVKMMGAVAAVHLRRDLARP